MGAVFLVGTHDTCSGLIQSADIRQQWIDLLGWCGPKEECPSSEEVIPQLILPPSDGADHILLDLTLHLLLQETSQLAAFGCAGPSQSAWVLLASATGLGRHNLLPLYNLTTLLVIPSPFSSLAERLTSLEIDLNSIDQALPMQERDTLDLALPHTKWVSPSGGGAAGLLCQMLQAEKSLIIGRQGHTLFLSIWEKV